VHIYRVIINYIQHNHQYHIPLLKLSQPVLINTGWAKSRYTVILYYILYTYFWHTLYKITTALLAMTGGIWKANKIRIMY